MVNVWESLCGSREAAAIVLKKGCSRILLNARVRTVRPERVESLEKITSNIDEHLSLIFFILKTHR